MTIKGAITALTAISLISAPVVAQASPADLQQGRVGSQVEGESLGGGLILPLAALIAAILFIVLVTDDSNEPVSP